MTDYDKMSKNELISVLSELHKDNEALKEFYERDMILLKEAEKQVYRSEEKFRKAFITSPDSVNINRLSDGLYVSINEGLTKLMGYSEEETLDRTSLEMNIWDDTDNRKMIVSQLLKNGKIENFEAGFRHKDGSIVFGLMSASLNNENMVEVRRQKLIMADDNWDCC